MSDVKVTEADREAVSALIKALADKQKFAAVFSLVPSDLYRHFAAHAARAVQAERKRLIGLAEAMMHVYATEYAGQEASGALTEIAEELADQLQQGAG